MALSRCKHFVFNSSSSFRNFCTISTTEANKLSNESARIRRNKLFDNENARQLGLIARIEKIQVSVKGPPENQLLIMNKGLSTPYNCALHINEHIRDLSVLALVNGRPWDLHRPLVEDCELSFLHFRDEDPRLANKAYWRSCSFLMGLLAETAFKDDFYIEVHSWPSPDIRSGSFVYDVDLKMQEWKPTKEELRVMSILIKNICAKNMNFERLEVDAKIALDMFAENRYKREQIPEIAASSPGGKNVTLYRVGDYIDISRGPMVARTGLVGHYAVSAVYPLTTDYGILHRFQGISLPKQIQVNHFVWKILKERSAKVNPSRVPRVPSEELPFETPMHRTTTATNSSNTLDPAA